MKTATAAIAVIFGCSALGLGTLRLASPDQEYDTLSNHFAITGTEGWANAGNASGTPDRVFASVSFPNSSSVDSDWLEGEFAPFTLTGSTVTGVEVTYYGVADSTVITMNDGVTIRWFDPSSKFPDDPSSHPITNAYFTAGRLFAGRTNHDQQATYGSSTYLWGITASSWKTWLTGNGSGHDFAVALSIQYPMVIPAGSWPIVTDVDTMQVSVYYTTPQGESVCQTHSGKVRVAR